ANFDPYRLLLLNTNVSHNLSLGEYNLRREQCETGLHLLSKKNNVKKSFRHITKKMVQNCEEQLDPIVFNRCLYVVEEIERVLQAVDFLKEKDLDSFGKLMFETHDGLSEKYDVSCPELDFLVKFAKTERRILGARLMGGGFGGCTINLIHKDAVEEFVDKASRAYKTMFGIELSHFQTVPSQGTHLIKRL
ncbi:MAG: galactokinase, partial [Bacteroidota bacterium]